MEIVVNEKTKIVEVWLRRDEQELYEQLKPQFAEWKRKDYLPAVFLSGEKDLEEETAALLRFNRRRNAELAVRREKMQA